MLVFCLFSIVSSVTMKYGRYEIVKKSKVDEAFDADYSKESTCRDVKSFYADGSTDSTKFTIESKENSAFDLSVTSEKDKCDPRLNSYKMNLLKNKKSDIKVHYNCREDGWDIITLSITNTDNGNDSFDLVWRKYCGDKSAMDWGLLILFLTAILIVSFAAYRARIAAVWENRIEDQSDVLTVHHAYGFVIVASLTLVLLFFFIDYLSIVLDILFCLSGTVALLGVICEFNIEPLWPNVYVLPVIGSATGAMLAALVVSIGVILTYVFTRFWILNNLIGLSFAYIIIKTVKIPNFKVGGLLLGLGFFYDIFWVFISQYAFGDNVMVAVAAKVDLPVKILCPHFMDSAYPYSCSMLGIGDLALPGLFLAFASRFDRQNSTNYLKVMIICYGVALLLCIFVLVVSKHAQPALLYISPLLIFGMLGYAYKRKEVQNIIDGLKSENNQLIRNEIPLSEIGS